MKIIKNKVWRLLCAITLCAGVAFFVATCGDDDDDKCKICTKAGGATIKACTDQEVKDAEDLGLTCK